MQHDPTLKNWENEEPTEIVQTEEEEELEEEEENEHIFVQVDANGFAQGENPNDAQQVANDHAALANLVDAAMSNNEMFRIFDGISINDLVAIWRYPNLAAVVDSYMGEVLIGARWQQRNPPNGLQDSMSSPDAADSGSVDVSQMTVAQMLDLWNSGRAYPERSPSPDVDAMLTSIYEAAVPWGESSAQKSLWTIIKLQVDFIREQQILDYLPKARSNGQLAVMEGGSAVQLPVDDTKSADELLTGWRLAKVFWRPANKPW